MFMLKSCPEAFILYMITNLGSYVVKKKEYFQAL